MTLMQRRRAMMGVKKGGGRLPAEYQEVEYIRATGTQYILTSIIPQKVTVFVDFQFVAGSVYPYSLFGGNGRTDYLKLQNGPALRITDNANVTLWTAPASENTNRHTALINDTDGNAFVDGNLVVTSGNFDLTQNGQAIAIFAYHNVGSFFYKSKAYLFRLTVWDKTTGEMLGDFVPCYRKADGEIGMYNCVGEKFLTNAGTGTFEKGANV